MSKIGNSLSSFFAATTAAVIFEGASVFATTVSVVRGGGVGRSLCMIPDFRSLTISVSMLKGTSLMVGAVEIKVGYVFVM